MEKNRFSRTEKGQLYYPLARVDKEMPTQGYYGETFSNSYPKGAVIHYTASGASLYDIDHGIKNNLCYWLIAEDGTVFQTAPLNRWGWHAGKSKHPKLGESLSSKLLGIEVDCPGKLQRGPRGWRTWYGKYVPDELVNVVHGEGFYRFTAAQQHALERVLIWLKINDPLTFDLEYVVGHEEISSAKSDPGGSLGMSLDDFRGLLKTMYKDELRLLGL